MKKCEEALFLSFVYLSDKKVYLLQIYIIFERVSICTNFVQVYTFLRTIMKSSLMKFQSALAILSERIICYYMLEHFSSFSF